MYIRLKNMKATETKKFWSFIFNHSDSFSFRYDCDNKCVLDSNRDFISLCEKRMIKHFQSYYYLYDKYGKPSNIFLCKMFNDLKEMVYSSPVICDWEEENQIQDLCFFKDNSLLLYSCFHEDLMIIFVNNNQLEILKSISNDFDTFLTKHDANELPKI